MISPDKTSLKAVNLTDKKLTSCSLDTNLKSRNPGSKLVFNNDKSAEQCQPEMTLKPFVDNRLTVIKELAKENTKLLKEEASDLTNLAADFLNKQFKKFGEVSVTPVVYAENITTKQNNYDDIRVEGYFPEKPAKRVRVDLLLQKDKEITRLPIWFSVKIERDILLAKHQLKIAEVISNDSLVMKFMDIFSVGCTPLETYPEDISRVKRSLKKGEVICQQDLEKSPIIKRNQKVKLLISSKSIYLMSDAFAKSDGMVGDTIPVQVMLTGLQVLAVIINNETVRYEKGL